MKVYFSLKTKYKKKIIFKFIYLLQSSRSTGPNKSRLTLAKWFALGTWHRTFGDFLYNSDMNKGFSTLALILFFYFIIFLDFMCLQNGKKSQLCQVYQTNHKISMWRQWCVIVVVTHKRFFSELVSEFFFHEIILFRFSSQTMNVTFNQFNT